MRSYLVFVKSKRRTKVKLREFPNVTILQWAMNQIMTVAAEERTWH